MQLPDFLRGQVHVLGLDFGAYRLFLIVVVVAITLALTWLIERTRFGAEVRASVDNQQASAGLGINVERVFSLTFALGSGLAGLGGGLGIDVLGLDPTFPLKYMVYFLLVVAVGGAGTIKGPLFAALILGVFDVAGKYYVPQLGSFVIYVVMVAMLLVFPRGLVGAPRMKNVRRTPDAASWSRLEIGFWLLPLIAFFLFPKYLTLGSQILIAGLFALSLDLILGYARIISLGHAAFSASAPTPRVCSPSTAGASRSAASSRRRSSPPRWVSSPAFWSSAGRISRA